MIHDNTIRSLGKFLDELVTPPGRTNQRAAQRAMLARRIKNIAVDLSLEGRDADANVLYEVVDALGGIPEMELRRD